MKKIIFTALSILILISVFSVSVFATETNTEKEKEFDIEIYLTERIAPVCVGVATSLIALIGTISKVKTSVTSITSAERVIKEVKESTSDALNTIKTELNMGIKEMESHVCQIDEIKKGYDQLKERYEGLLKKNRSLMEAIKLGFASLPDAVESGAARKIAIITEENTDLEA